MSNVSGMVESKSRKGNSIKVDGDWYSTFKAEDLNHVNWKDNVVFAFEQKGEYKNIKGKVQRSGGSSASPAKSGGGYSTLGVEMGHASNLAMRMMEQHMNANLDSAIEIGSPEYYKQFLTYTETVYKLMRQLKAKHEESNEKVVPVATKSEKTELSDDDIFG